MRPAILLLLSLFSLAAAADGLAAAPFVRGDANIDDRIDISDGIKVLGILFLGDEEPGCRDALDVNDDGRIDISDGAYALNFLFTGGPDVPPPSPDCGEDPTDDDLACDAYPFCSDVACFSAGDLDELVRANVPDVACVPPDAAQFEAAGLIITACRRAEAEPSCGDSGEPGCPVEFTSIASILEEGGSRARIAIAGRIADLPITFGEDEGALVCRVAAEFSGAALVEFEGSPAPGGFEVTSVGEPAIVDVELDLSAPGELLCRLLENQEELFREALASQLENAAADLSSALSAQVVGSVVCGG